MKRGKKNYLNDVKQEVTKLSLKAMLIKIRVIDPFSNWIFTLLSTESDILRTFNFDGSIFSVKGIFSLGFDNLNNSSSVGSIFLSIFLFF